MMMEAARRAAPSSLRRSSTSYSKRWTRRRNNALLPPCRSAPPPDVAIAPLAPRHAASALRLQRLARLAGAPVFGDGSGAAEATAAACAEEHGAFGFVAVDLEEQEEEGEGEGVVGVVVGQREAAATVVLLTLAIRADRRRQGIGRALVDALATRAKEQEGAKAVVADVARDNAPALAALAAAGFCFDGGGGKKSKVLEGVLEL